MQRSPGGCKGAQVGAVVVKGKVLDEFQVNILETFISPLFNSHFTASYPEINEI